MRWRNCLATLLFATAVAIPTQAAVFLDVGDITSLECGCYLGAVTAVATAGETISGFGRIRLTNVHQVFGVGGNPTPFVDNHIEGWVPAWSAYDSHILIPASQRVALGVSPLTETNDGSTTGILRLSPLGPLIPTSGFGDLASVDGLDGFALLPEAQGQTVTFLQVVTHRGDWWLDVDVVTSAGVFEFRGVGFGLIPPPDGEFPQPPPLGCIIPEPASIVLLTVALVAVAGCNRWEVRRTGRS